MPKSDTPQQNRPILIVDDEPDIRELLAITLNQAGLATIAAANVAEAIDLLNAQPLDLCICDLRLPDGDGLTVVRHAQQVQPQMPVAVISAHGNMELAIKAMKAGAFDFVAKPTDINSLRQLVEQALRVSARPAQIDSKPSSNHARPSGAPPLIGDSEAMQSLRNMVEKLARSQVPVHIGGESGSGKEVVARSIHSQGPRNSGPFIAVNCGAIPSELMESEFFGHQKGSFSGAHSDKQGLFQAANGGTLFLDEIADLPLTMQVKLLRAIQQRAIRPVGGNDEIPVDVRLLSASHRHLAEMVSAGDFRQDLFYRINVISIEVPTLRQRLEDLPALVDHLLARQFLRHSENNDGVTGNIPPRLSADALRVLQQHNFPGNVRELENTLERALALSDGQTIEAEHLQQTPAPAANQAEPTPALAAQIELNSELSLEQQLEAIEREALQRALETTRFNKTAAAETLGISFRSFRYRLKKLGME